MEKQQFINDWDNIAKLKMFEVPVWNHKNNEKDYLLFHISIDKENNLFRAEHEATSDEEEESDKIAFCSVELDYDYSVDVNLQELHEECMNKIIDSQYFRLA